MLIKLFHKGKLILSRYVESMRDKRSLVGRRQYTFAHTGLAVLAKPSDSHAHNKHLNRQSLLG